MRILIISNLYPPHYLGGAELLCQHVVEPLARNNTVKVLASDFNSTIKYDLINNITVIRSLKLYLYFGETRKKPIHRRWYCIAADRANRGTTRAVLDDFKPDVVFVWSQRRLGLAPALTCQDAGYPVVFIFNDDSPRFFIPSPLRKDQPRSWILYLIDRFIFYRYTTYALNLEFTTCISQSLKDDMLAEGLPIPASRVIHQGIPVEKFPCKARPGELGSPMRVLYVGQILHSKGVHTLLEAVDVVAGRRGAGSIRLTIVGDGPGDYRQGLMEGNKNAYAIDWLGKKKHDELPEIYRDHDLFVFPSIVKEGFGLTFLEAMACGLPVIATATGGQGECLVDGVNSLVFPPGDVRLLAECIMRLLDDPGLRTGIALAGRAMVEKDYSLEGFTAKLESFLAESITGFTKGARKLGN